MIGNVNQRAWNLESTERDTLFRTLDGAAPGFVHLADPDGRILYANQTWYAYTGISRLDDKTLWQSFCHPDDLNRFEESRAQAGAGGQEFTAEYRYRRGDGVYRWMQTQLAPVRNPAGEITQWVGITVDIDDRKNGEIRLAETEKQIRLAVEGADLVTWDMDVTTGRVICSENANQIWGLASGSADEFWARVHPEDRAEAMAAVNRSLTGHTDLMIEYRVRGTDGVYRWLHSRGKVELDSAGNSRRFVGISADVSQRKRVEAELRERERRFSAVLANIPDIIARHDRDHRVIFVSDAITRATGRPAHEFIGKLPMELGGPPEFAHRWDDALSQAFATGRSVTLEFSYPAPEGTRWYMTRLVPEPDETGAITSVLAVTSDVTTLREAEQAAQRTAAFHLSLGNAIPGLVWATDAKGVVNFVNQTFTEYTGLTLEEYAPHAGTGMGVHPDDVARIQGAFAQARALRASCELEFRYQRRDGGYRWFLGRVIPVLDDHGAVVRWVGTSIDIDDRKHAQEALEENEARLRLALRAARAGTWDYNVAARSGVWSEECYRLYGVAPGTEATYAVWLRQVHPDDRKTVDRAMDEAIANGSELDIVYRVRHPVEGERWLEEIGRTVADAAGRVTGMSGITIDITERKRAEEGLRLSEERFRTALRGSPIAIFNQDRELRYTWVHDPGLGVMGSPVLGKTDVQIWERPEDAAVVTAIKRRVLETGQHDRHEISVHLGGVPHVYDLTLEPLRDSGGEVIGLTGAVVDMSERKQIEERLRQSAKMEAIGQLAGGLAHDFNNQLHALSGLLEFVAHDPGLSEVGQRDVAEIQNATERMATLTRQLLAFSRQQVLVPETVDLNDAVAQTKPMLQRLIGSNLEMRLDLEPGQKWVRVDRTQLIQVLMNLVINARDAMPDGGELALQTGTRTLDSSEFNVKTRGRVGRGQYALLIVRDTGKGIDPENLSRIFEPFFTTKPVGEGTGLGLATVDGIVSQNEGHIWVESVPGSGSTFTILLPLAAAPINDVSIDKPLAFRGDLAGKVLVVDDEDLVRQVLVRTLEAEGFEVLEARDGQAALELLESLNGKVDLVVSDVVMPVMGGSELADRLNQRFPDLRVIWMSGYPRDTVFSHGRLGQAGQFLQKPIPPDLLIGTVMTALRELGSQGSIG